MENNRTKNVVILRSTSIKNDSRVTKEAMCLSRNGYNVEILGWDRDGFLNDDNNIRVDNNIVSIRAFKERAQYGAGIKSLLKLIKFQIWLLYHLTKQRRSIDIIHSCDLDTAIPARIIAKIFKKKLVYDIFDYYIDSHHVPKKIEGIVEKIEINIINKADLTIICTEQRKEQIKKSNPKKCIVIYNTPQIIAEKINNKIIKSDTNKIKIGYVGILQGSRLLEEICEKIKQNDSIELHIGGFGKLQEYFEQSAQNHENIFYYGQMKYEEVLALEKDCDILFATYNPAIPNHKYSAPNKLYEAMALGKPIIVCKGTGIDSIVEREKTGFSIEYNADEFIKCINKLEKDEMQIKEFGDNAQKIYNEKYSWKQMEKELIDKYQLL